METATFPMALSADTECPLGMLHIDDSPSEASLLNDILSHKSSELRLVAHASSLAEGLGHSSDQGVDCIITDLDLPDSEGLEAVRRLVQHYPRTPIIVLTSRDEAGLGRQAIAAGAQDFIPKENLEHDWVVRVVKYAVERMRLRIRNDEARLRMQIDLRHKERVLQLSRRMHRARNLESFCAEFKAHFCQFFDAGQFSLFVFKPKDGWTLACHNHSDWVGNRKGALQLKGVMAECVAQGRAIAYKQMRYSPYGAPNAHRYALDNAISLPLKVDDHIVGVLNLNDNPGESFEDDMLANIAYLAEHLGLALFNVLSYEEYQGLAHCDGLTGLYNRWYLHRQLPQEISRSRRYGLSLSAVICDIDHFKLVNDTHGHPVGDEVLAAFSKLLVKMVRDSDLAFRIGGEEFLLLLPNTTGKDAMNLAERIRGEWSREWFLTPESKSFQSTASFGICELPRDCEADSFLAFADRALYRAKQEGRNRCVMG